MNEYYNITFSEEQFFSCITHMFPMKSKTRYGSRRSIFKILS